MYNKLHLHAAIGHVRYINILAWFGGFRVTIADFSSFFCPSIPKRDLDTTKTTPNIYGSLTLKPRSHVASNRAYFKLVSL